MERLLALLYITLTILMVFSPHVNTDEICFHQLDGRPPTYNSRFPIDFGWFVERYDFDRIEGYIDEYYGTYFKHWERYLTSKQRELAGKFGLSDIFLKPNFKRYENTKVVLSRKIWNDRLLLKYLASAGNMGDFEFFIALKPYRFTTFIAKGHVNGERSIAVVISKSFGSNSRNSYRDADRRTRRLLGKARRLVGCN